jgi:hypothetical protein
MKDATQESNGLAVLNDKYMQLEDGIKVKGSTLYG